MAATDPLAALRAACLAAQRDFAHAALDLAAGESRSAEVLRHYAGVCSPQTLAVLEEAMHTASSERQRELRCLRAWVLETGLRAALLPHQEALREQQRALYCEVDEEPLSLPAAFAAMAGESRRERRAAIEAALVERLDTLAAPVAEAFAALQGYARQHGFATPAALWAAILPVDPAALPDVLSQTLKDTEDVYLDLLAWAVRRRLGVPLGQLRRHDVLALFSFAEYHHYYQPGSVLPALQASLRAMGIDPAAAGRLHWQFQREQPGPALAAAPAVPQEVVLVCGQAGGVKGAERAAAACGRALLWAYTSEEVPELLRVLGDAAVVEGSAVWLANTVAHPGWLRAYLGVRVDGSYEAWRQLDTLYRLRREIARLLFAHHLATQDTLQEAADIYRDLLMEACRVAYAGAYYVLDWDWAYTTLTALRARILARALETALRQQCGDDWYRNPDSGALLREFWGKALAESAETLSQDLTGTAWDALTLARSLLAEGR